MAYTLSNGSVVATVATDAQLQEKLQLGWTLVSGSATASATPWENTTDGKEPKYRGFSADAKANSYDALLAAASQNATTNEQIKKAKAAATKKGFGSKSGKAVVFGLSDTNASNATSGTLYIKTDGNAVMRNSSTWDVI